MLQITYSPEDLRLLEAADIAEEESKKGLYDQEKWGTGCGTPACLLGGYAWRHPKSAAYEYIVWNRNVGPVSVCSDLHWRIHAEFGIDPKSWLLLFGAGGCDNAQWDGVKAAAFVRRFVEERAKARLTV